LSETLAESAANAQRVIDSERRESGEVTKERVSLIRKIMFMNVKDRMKLVPEISVTSANGSGSGVAEALMAKLLTATKPEALTPAAG